MSEQSRIAFERNVAIREANHIHDADAYFKARPQIDNADRRKVFEAGHCRAWNAATLESAERIAALEGEVAELTRDRDEWKDSTITANRRFEIAEQSSRELQANNHDLREAIRKIEFEYDYCSDADMTNAVKEAMTLISATPAESLAKHDDEVIERCAIACDDFGIIANDVYIPESKIISKAIRALKVNK